MEEKHTQHSHEAHHKHEHDHKEHPHAEKDFGQEMKHMNWKHLLTSFSGTITTNQFVLGIVAIAVGGFVINNIVGMLFYTNVGYMTGFRLVVLIHYALNIAYLWMFLALVVKKFFNK